MSVYKSESGNSSTSQLNLETDVLVIGGGPSATWAVWNAAAQGVREAEGKVGSPLGIRGRGQASPSQERKA